MKVHQQFARAFWNSSDPNSTTNTCKHLRPLVPKFHDTAIDLKSFLRPKDGPKTDQKKVDIAQESSTPLWQQGQGGGMRWNPTHEQIGILEKLYKGGMRTPNVEQIEQITAQLSKYGKVEGKNVFYWFQNHKARERQKQKRNISYASTNSKEEQALAKKKCMTWAFDYLVTEETTKGTTLSFDNERDEDEEEEMVTLNLFPLHPEGR